MLYVSVQQSMSHSVRDTQPNPEIHTLDNWKRFCLLNKVTENSMDFSFQSLRTPTRFETTGKILERKLLEAQRIEDPRVYPHQIDAVLKVKAKLAEYAKETCNDPVLVVAPTGSGKTGIITLLPYILQCGKVLILTPSRIISKQLGESFGIFDNYPTFFEKIGLCPRAKRDEIMEHGQILSRGRDVTLSVPNLVIVTAQTFEGNRLVLLGKNRNNHVQEKTVVTEVKEFFGRFDTLIVDEAHHYPVKTWCEIEKTFRSSNRAAKQLIFLTATPVRKNGKSTNILPNQRISYAINRNELDGKYIRPMRFKEEENEEKLLSHIKAVLEDKDVLDSRFWTPQKFRMPQAMILVNNRMEADKLAMDLNVSEGNPNFAVSIHGGDAAFKEKTNEFKNGKKYQVAITCGLLLEGFDNAAVTLCVILRHLDSKVLFNQFISRCMTLMKFDDEPKDRTIGTVLSYPKYNQKQMFEDRDSLAVDDPVETKIEEEGAKVRDQPCTSQKHRSVRKQSQGTIPMEKKRRMKD